MKTMTANEAKQSFGRLLDDARREPVLIEKHKRPAAVLISSEEYDRLRGLNVAQFSAFCDRIGQRAEAAGLTAKKLEKLIR
ncbi:MAG TPA: type II toxin-antitoxin system Phd/YefM family antitoxin [Opitutales bacterium]|nr:type II toxin-antitoxin system Phd/YefM family antitoxin [Opitutales bacterium]